MILGFGRRFLEAVAIVVLEILSVAAVVVSTLVWKREQSFCVWVSVEAHVLPYCSSAL